MKFFQPSPLEKITDPLFEEKGVEVFIKRDDLIHPYVMGNKWRKLKYNLQFAKEHHYKGILTLGGAYSNHIAATAAACNENGLKSTGIIRGDELNEQSNATLRFATSQNMELIFLSRSRFRSLRNEMARLQDQFPEYYCLPEGGTNSLAIKGCEELVNEITIPFDYLATPIGTGGTMAGILKGLKGTKRLLGFSALKGSFVKDEFTRLKETHNIRWGNYEIITRFHFGGYGKVPDQLVDFINNINVSHGLLLDPIYTGKMYFGLISLIREDFFQPNTRIIAVHTGGLQGIEGFNTEHTNKILF